MRRIELADAGFLYIAQPPLFMVKKGKKERYIKDERGLEEYLLGLALENGQLEGEGAAERFDSPRRRLLGWESSRSVAETEDPMQTAPWGGFG